jgi:hypothetical protein
VMGFESCKDGGEGQTDLYTNLNLLYGLGTYPYTNNTTSLDTLERGNVSGGIVSTEAELLANPYSFFRVRCGGIP